MASRFNCAPKFDQPVKIPTREIVHNVFEDFKDSILNRVYAVDEFVKEIGGFIASRFSVDVLHATAIEVDLEDINLNAYYDSEEDELCKISIQLVIVTNPYETCVLLNKTDYVKFVNNIADALIHELVHMKQSRDRDFFDPMHYCKYDSSCESEYLSNPDEIDAYSYNIASELKEHTDPIKKLVNAKLITIADSVNLWAYVNTFDKDFQNPILKKILKKVYKKLS